MGDVKSAAWIAVLRAVAALPLLLIQMFGWGPVPRFGIIGAAIAMLTYYTFGVIGMVGAFAVRPKPCSSQAFRSSAAKAAFLPHSQGGIAFLGAILLNSVALIAITAFVARFGVEALAGYGFASRLELLIFSLVLALGVGATTMVGHCVGVALSTVHAA